MGKSHDGNWRCCHEPASEEYGRPYYGECQQSTQSGSVAGDREVWDDRKGGQILFSDDENSTVNFDRGALNVERGVNSHNMDRLKQLLTGLKD